MVINKQQLTEYVNNIINETLTPAREKVILTKDIEAEKLIKNPETEEKGKALRKRLIDIVDRSEKKNSK